MPSPFRRALRCWAVVPLLLLAGPVRAQPGTTTVTDLQAELGKFKSPNSVNALLKGTTPADPTKEEHRDALKAEARYVAYRIHSDEYHKPFNPFADRPGETNPKSIH